MADFGYFSDTDDSAVEELISEAKDLSVLEQVSKINCSSFTESDLPCDLETRFRKLKSFPVSKPKSPVADNARHNCLYNSKSELKSKSGYFFDDEDKNFSTKKESQDGIFLNKKEDPDVIFSPSEQKSNSFEDSPSPPRKAGCFWCSPKKESKRKSKENWSVDWGNKSDEFLSDLSTFSVKEQQKMLKKAMKEEEKISREAEKIVKWAKQASARMSLHGVEDELSDDDTTK